MAFPIEEHKEADYGTLYSNSEVIHIFHDEDTGENACTNMGHIGFENDFKLQESNSHNSFHSKRTSVLTRKSSCTGSLLRNRSALILLVLVLMISSIQAKIQFNMMNTPAYFGESVTISCRMTPSPGQMVKPMAWFKNVTNQVSLDGSSYYPWKYQISMVDDNYTMIYYLTILSFSDGDVNIFYRCDFGFQSLIEPLNLDNGSFISLPKRNLTKPELFYSKNDTLEGHVRLLNVYPMPICNVLYSGQSCTTGIIITSDQKSIFYNVTLTITSEAKLPSCSGELNISCHFGKIYTQVLHEEINMCNGTTGEKSELKIDMIIGIAAVVVSEIVCVVVLIIICKKKLNRGTIGEKYEMKIGIIIGIAAGAVSAIILCVVVFKKKLNGGTIGEKYEMKTGIIVGIAAAGLVSAIFLCVVVIKFTCKKKLNRESQETQNVKYIPVKGRHKEDIKHCGKESDLNI